MTRVKVGPGTAIVIALVFIAGLVGWVMNVFDLIGMIGASVDAEFVLRIVGVFVAPLGAVLGYF